MEKPDWQKLELLVAKIQKSLAPDAVVQHNVKLQGLITEVSRQIDVLVTQTVGQYKMMIAIDCKDYNCPVDIKGVEAFLGLINDIGAQKGAMVAPKGFTSAAKNRARKAGIELYSPVDTDPHKWKVNVTAPVLCKSRTTTVSFGLRFTLPLPMNVSPQFYQDSVVYNEERKKIGTPQEIFSERWSEGKYSIDVGAQENIPLIGDQQCYMDNGYGQIVEFDLSISTYTEEERFFGNVSISDISGLRDEQTGLVHTRELTTKVISPRLIIKTWKKLTQDQEPPVKPLFEMVMIDTFKMR